MGEDSQLAQPVILLSTADGPLRELVSRVATLGFLPVCCPTFDSAVMAIEQAEDPVHCALIPSELAERGLKRELKGLRKAGAHKRLHLVAVGIEPDRAGHKLLRAAGIKYALWEPLDASLLRFQLNRLTHASPDDEMRRSRRVPTLLPARATAGGRGRRATVYSLSASGAFLETPRACMTGAQVEVELQLPDSLVTLSATVAYANVPGNLQRPNLPLGMAIRFSEPSADDTKALTRYVASRLAQLAV